MPDLNDLKLFHDIVKAGGFSAAHRITGQSRATLSRHLNSLEDKLGTRLIERSTRSFRLTEPGKLLYERSIEIMSQLDEAVALVEDRQHEPRGLVRIAVPPSLLQMNIGREILDYLQANGQVRVQIEVSNREVDIRHEGFDFVLRARARLDYPLDYALVRLAEMPLALVAHPRWQPQLQSTLAATLEQVPVITWKGINGQSHWDLLTAEGQTKSVTLQPRLIVDDISTLRQAVLAGIGLTLIPRNFVEEDIALGRLIPIELDLLPNRSIVHAVHLGQRGMRPAVRHLLNWLKRSTQHLRNE